MAAALIFCQRMRGVALSLIEVRKCMTKLSPSVPDNKRGVSEDVEHVFDE